MSSSSGVGGWGGVQTPGQVISPSLGHTDRQTNNNSHLQTIVSWQSAQCVCVDRRTTGRTGSTRRPQWKRVGRHCTSMSPHQCLTKDARAATVKDSTDHPASSLRPSVLQLPQQTI